jgi:hypothetical protein
MHRFLITLFCYVLSFTVAKAQSNRLSNTNAIGWLALFGNIKCNSKFSVHTEAQFRAINLAEKPQQILLRSGLQYAPNKNLLLRAGYAHAETYAYGSIPINNFGKRFTEHRLFEMLQVNTKINSTDWQHRFMLEQRWGGRYANALSKKEDEFVYTNRIRYMLRAQKPIGKKLIENNTWYIGGFNEVFISFGKKVADNVFDQNRISIYTGYKVNNKYRVEFGLLNQTQQLGRRVDGKAVYHYNTGIYINNYFSF